MKNVKVIILLMAALSVSSSLYSAGSDPNMTASSIQGLDETTGYYYLSEFGGAAKNEQWMNVQDRDESYKSWAAVRFDLSTIKNQINTAYGVGNWEVIKVELVLWESSVGWARAGEVEVRWTNDDSVNITFESPKSPLIMYDVPNDPIQDQFATCEHDTTGAGVLVNMIPYSAPASYTEVAHVLFDKSGTNSTGATLIAEDIRTDNTLTLALVDDGHVKAGYVGYKNSYTNEHPMLRVTAVPSGHVPVCENRPVFDATGPDGVPDCKVNFYDFVKFAEEWLVCGYADPADCL